jgi:hypothetical protein
MVASSSGGKAGKMRFIRINEEPQSRDSPPRMI